MTDDGKPKKSATVGVVVNIDRNLFAPTFGKTEYTAVISEDLDPGSLISTLAGQLRVQNGDKLVSYFFFLPKTNIHQFRLWQHA